MASPQPIALKISFAMDSSLEGDGFELPVPRLRNWRNSRRAGTFQLHGRRLVRAAIRPQSPAYLYVGGGTKDFAPYILMIAALMVRPEGIFGRRRIERV